MTRVDSGSGTLTMPHPVPTPVTRPARAVTYKRQYLTPLSIALGYAIIGTSAIAFSHRADKSFAGIGFVLATALGLFILLRLSRRGLLERERRYRAMFEETSAVALLLDPARGTIVDANDAAADFYGWPRNQLVGRGIAELALVADASGDSSGAWKAGDRTEMCHRTAAGGIRHVEVYPAELDVQGRRLLYVIVHDLTGRLEAEHGRDQSEARYRTLLDEASDGIFLVNPDGMYVDVNPKGCEMLGYTRQELLRLRIWDLLPPDEATRQPMRFDELQSRSTLLSERRLRRKDGRYVHVEISARRRDDGLIQGVARDVTGRRELEERLRQAQKMEAIGQLTGGIAHDINNVLGIVIANADLIRQEVAADNREVHHDLDEVKRAAHRGAEMIRKLLGFSRRSALDVVPLDLTVAVSEVVATLRRLLPSNITIDYAPAGPVAVRADRTSLDQILLNLATNARDAMPEGGTLSVSVGEVTLTESDAIQGAFGCITVRDSGQGMPEEVRARVFEPFFTTKPPGQGSGLGMAMVYGLVKQQDGTVRIETAPGTGTTVSVCLPIAGSPVERRDTARRNLPTGSETVLLVEDEAPLRNAASRILQRLGYTVLAAADGEDALEIFGHDGGRTAIVVSDIMMPRRNGRSLYDAVRATGRPVRFLFSSGYSGTPIDGLGDTPDAPPFLRKPWTAEELAMKVREVLDR